MSDKPSSQTGSEVKAHPFMGKKIEFVFKGNVRAVGIVTKTFGDFLVVGDKGFYRVDYCREAK